MPEIFICREHQLGIHEAQRIARHWLTEAEADYGMDCVQDEICALGSGTNRWSFSRSGVSGTLTVSADRFELQMKLGFLLGAFKERIESAIQGNLDRVLVQGAAGEGCA